VGVVVTFGVIVGCGCGGRGGRVGGVDGVVGVDDDDVGSVGGVGGVGWVGCVDGGHGFLLCWGVFSTDWGDGILGPCCWSTLTRSCLPVCF